LADSKAGGWEKGDGRKEKGDGRQEKAGQQNLMTFVVVKRPL